MGIISGILGILVFLLVLSLVIIIHELGHFIAARKAGILCHEFSLGMGPVVWSKKKGETVYSIRLFPLGGFVAMAGEELKDEVIKVGDQVRVIFNEQRNVKKLILDHKEEKWQEYELVTVEKIDLVGHKKDGFFTALYINDYAVARDAMYVVNGKEIQLAPADRNFNTKNKRQRFLAIFGGPFMNFVLAFFVFVLFGLVRGFPAEDSSQIGIIGAASPAEGHIIEGDVITQIDGVDIFSWEDISTELDRDLSVRSVEFRLTRNGDPVFVTIEPVIEMYSVGLYSMAGAGEDLLLGGFFGDNKRVQVCLTENVITDEGADELSCNISNQGDEYSTFLEDDEIIEIDQVPVNDWGTVISIIQSNTDGDTIEFTIIRDGSEVEITIIEPWGIDVLDTQGLPLVDSSIGIGPMYSFNLFKSLGYGVTGIKDSSTMIFDTLALLFDNDQVGVSDLAGPLGIYQLTSNALSQGFASLLGWVGLLSVNLAVINLLPIPALDGGRLVFLGYEALTGHKPNQKVENTLHYVMYLLLMSLFVFITYNDILRLIGIK